MYIYYWGNFISSVIGLLLASPVEVLDSPRANWAEPLCQAAIPKLTTPGRVSSAAACTHGRTARRRSVLRAACAALPTACRPHSGNLRRSAYRLRAKLPSAGLPQRKVANRRAAPTAPSLRPRKARPAEPRRPGPARRNLHPCAYPPHAKTALAGHPLRPT